MLEKIRTMRLRDMKREMEKIGIDTAGCVEKEAFEQLLQERIVQVMAPLNEGTRERVMREREEDFKAAMRCYVPDKDDVPPKERPPVPLKVTNRTKDLYIKNRETETRLRSEATRDCRQHHPRDRRG